MEKVNGEQLSTSFHNKSIGRHKHFSGNNKLNSFPLDIMKAQTVRESKNS